MARSSLADSAGATSLVFSFTAATVVLLTIFLLGSVFSLMPRVVGSAIIVVAALGLFEMHDIVFLWRLRAFSSLLLLAFTFVVTLAVGVELGVMLSLVISLFLVLKR